MSNVGVSPINSQLPDLSSLSDVAGYGARRPDPSNALGEIGSEKDTHAEPARFHQPNTASTQPFEGETLLDGENGKDYKPLQLQPDYQPAEGVAISQEMDPLTRANTLWNANVGSFPITSPPSIQFATTDRPLSQVSIWLSLRPIIHDQLRVCDSKNDHNLRQDCP